MKTINNVAIIIAATAIIDDDSTVFISVFGQGLKFTKRMYKGIFNTNQCRSFDVQYVKNLNDTTRYLVFYANNVLLPFFIEVTNCLTDYFCPYDNEMRQFPWVLVSD